jgi:hypothetical protein
MLSRENVGFEKRALKRLRYFVMAKSMWKSAKAEAVKRALAGKWFWKAVDLGCGWGEYADVLRQHCAYLIGVDHNPLRLKIASESGLYDELHLADIRFYELPPDVDAVFILDVIEHLEKSEGLSLLQKLKGVPYIMVTTPSKYFPISPSNGHRSLWTREELENLGFKIQETYSQEIFTSLYGHGILAIKEKQVLPIQLPELPPSKIIFKEKKYEKIYIF